MPTETTKKLRSNSISSSQIRKQIKPRRRRTEQISIDSQKMMSSSTRKKMEVAKLKTNSIEEKRSFLITTLI